LVEDKFKALCVCGAGSECRRRAIQSAPPRPGS
jgi:hypothetical protein